MKTINEIHSYLFEDLSNIPSNEEVIKCFENNSNMIESCLQVSLGEEFNQLVRIKSEYCFALVETKQFEKAHFRLEETVFLFKKIYDVESEKLNNIFFEKLIFNTVVASYYLQDFKKSKQNIEKLLEYFPNNEAYLSWQKVISKKLRKGLRWW